MFSFTGGGRGGGGKGYLSENSNENIDQLVADTFKEKLNIDVNLSDISGSHRHYTWKDSEDEQRGSRPIRSSDLLATE